MANTNIAALAALQTLRSTQSDLIDTSRRVGSGLKVQTSLDNPVSFVLANDMQARMSTQVAIRDSLDRAGSIAELGISQAETLRDLLSKMRDKAQEATSAGLQAANYAALNGEFVALRDQITGIVNGATLNGANLINNTTQVLSVRVNDNDPTAAISYNAQDLTAAGLLLTAAAIDSKDAASTAVATISGAISTVNNVIATFAGRVRAADVAKTMSQSLSDGLQKAVSRMIDADLPTESARLQALQAKQQLGLQAMAIVNQQPVAMLQLFR